MTRDVDLLLEGGTVVDGTGAPGYPASVAVAGDRIVLPAPGETLRAARTCDATGLVIAPGFIDLHSHGGLVMLAEPRHEPKVRQGVTTEVIGVDGNSYAPFPDPGDLRDFVVLNGGLDGRPELDYDWATVAEHLARYDRRVAVNIACVVGNSPLRIAALGWDDVEAGATAIADQRSRLREAMEDGAFGLSTGLDYPPGSYATTAELAAIATEAARLGGIYHTHVRYPLGDGFLDPFREAIDIGRRSGAPVHITHFYHRATFPGTPDQMLALVDDARAEGLDVSFDLYPSEWASTRLLIMLPEWVHAGGIGPLRERLADRGMRARIRDELRARGRLFAGDRTWDELRIGALTRPEHLEWEGRMLGDLMRATGRDAVDAICDLLLAEDLRVNQVTPGTAPRRDPAVPPASRGDDRDRRGADRRQARAPDVRLLPADPGRARPGGALAGSRGGRPPDDGRAGGAARARGSGSDRRRPRRRPRRVRSGHDRVPGDLRRSAPLPGGDPAGARQRRAGDRRRRAHGRDAGALAAARTSRVRCRRAVMDGPSLDTRWCTVPPFREPHGGSPR